MNDRARRSPLTAALGLAIVVVVVAAVVAVRARQREGSSRCGVGFVARGPRCAPSPLALGACPPPLVLGPRGCDAPDVRVSVPAVTMNIGPSDWEAEGRVAPRTVTVAPFALDAFEATEAKVALVLRPNDASPAIDRDGPRAASGLSRDEAAAYCAARGGRLPTEDEWLAAAAGPASHRYPWGDTGAVCRRAAWGIAAGPCGSGATGPDTVGAHPDGDGAAGFHDLAGNVGEWVAPDPSAPARGVLHGGSWQTTLATDLRTWARREIDPASHDPSVGVRCAYDAAKAP